MPAEIILELSGEAVRSRLCTFTDAKGQELCLRPDLTTPIAKLVADGDIPASRYHSSGPVYRLPPRGSEDAIEHQQIGFEWFGQDGSIEEDADALAVALEAARAGGVAGASIRFGDVAIFHAVIDALAFSPRWKDRLRRAFSRRKGPRELLAAGHLDVSPLGVRIAAMTPPDATREVEAIIAGLGVQPVGGRGPEDIVQRLRDKAKDKAPTVETSAALVRYLDITAPVGGITSMLEAFAGDVGINIERALDAFRQRLERIAKLAPPFWSDAVFSAEVGRRFEYYDGFVFELAHDFERPIVSGGRYDGLITRLSGGERQASAIGAALRVDRLGGEGRS